MAPELPPPVRGGIDLAALCDARLDTKFEFKEIQHMFFLQDGIYIVQPCDPLRLGHVLWGKLAFCDFTHRLLIRCGKLPEVDPRAILVGIRKSLDVLQDKTPCLKSILTRLASPGEAEAFGFYSMKLGMVGAAKLLLRFVMEDDLPARHVRTDINAAVEAVASAGRGLSIEDIEKVRSEASRHFGVNNASFVARAPACAPNSSLSHERIQELRRAADVPLDTLSLDTTSLPDATTIREKVLQLSGACVKARNEAALREKLILACRLQANEVDAARLLIDQHLLDASSAPEMTASVMTPGELDAFVVGLADRRHVKILCNRWAIDEALSHRILEAAKKRGQAAKFLVSTTTPKEDEVVSSMLKDPENNDFHRSVCSHAADQLLRFRPGRLNAHDLQEAVRQLDPQLQQREKQLVKALEGKPLDEVAQQLHDFRDRVVLEELANCVDSVLFRVKRTLKVASKASAGQVLMREGNEHPT